MAQFEDIPEDREQIFPCPMCCDGYVSQDPEQGNMWQCNKCDWSPAPKETDLK